MKILIFEIKPLDSLIINSERHKDENDFRVNMSKVTGLATETELQTPNENRQIVISFPCGEGEGDLCTPEQADNITVTQISGDDVWKVWTETDEEKMIYRMHLLPSASMDFTKDYQAAFHVEGIITTAAQGAVNCSVKIANFSDVDNTTAGFRLFKYYPVFIREFEATPNKVNLNGKIKLAWEVESAAKVGINVKDMEKVDPKKTVELEITKPFTFILTATDHRGMDFPCHCPVTVKEPRVIRFDAGKESKFFPGEPVTLSWEIESAYDVDISPNVGSGLPLVGSQDVHPTADINYELTAKGYKGDVLVEVKKTIALKKWQWKKLGETSLPPKDDASSYNDLFYDHNGNMLLFANGKIYESNTTYEWRERETESPSAIETLKNYTTSYHDKTLYLSGGAGKSIVIGAVFACDMDATPRRWQVAQITHPAVVNTHYASAYSAKDICVHAILDDGGFFGAILHIFKSGDIYHTVEIPDSRNAEHVRVVYWNGAIYVAVMGRMRGISLVLYRVEPDGKYWEVIYSEKYARDYLCYLLPCDNDLYYIDCHGIRRHGDWSLLETLPPGVDIQTAYAGVINNRVYLLSTDGDRKGVVWQYV